MNEHLLFIISETKEQNKLNIVNTYCLIIEQAGMKRSFSLKIILSKKSIKGIDNLSNEISYNIRMIYKDFVIF